MITRLITGGTGFVGNNLIKRLLRDDNSRLILLTRSSKDLLAEERIERLLHGYDIQNVEVIEGNIYETGLGIEPRRIKDLEKEIDEIWHLAGSTDMDEVNRDLIFKANVEGSKHVLDFAKRIEELKLFGYTSTAYVAGKRKGLVLEDELYVGQEFNNPYEESKFFAEKMVRDYIKRGLRGIIFRPSVIVGDSQTGETQSFKMIYKPWLALQLVKERYLRKSPTPQYREGKIVVPLRVVGNGYGTLNIIPVNSVVDMMIKLSEDEANLGKVFHLTNPMPTTIGFLRDHICKHLGITGVEFVDSLELDNPNEWERFYSRITRAFIPYTTMDSPIFDRTNTNASLGSNYTPPPTEELMRILIDYCLRVNWGRKNNT